MSPGSSQRGPRDERGVLAAHILSVARTAFSEHGWAGTTIRGVARDADVDPSLVYHYFGSKKALLDASTNLPQSFLDRIADAWASPHEELGERLVALTLGNWQAGDSGPVLRAIVLIAAHEPGTRAKLRDLVTDALMGPALIGRGEQDRRHRSGFIASQLLGLGLMRYVWHVEPIASMSDGEVVAAVGPTIQRYVDDDLAPRA
ncbi:TetR family transcriptional regulator [Humibacter albus]|uniref:TetR/AcrR family transcriptional regulator n=1 Tax=Humibacter albus TaxID=427754 RepID=UPI0003B7847D|nr:TetR family transcriptional regulator [Humibacter albus]